jgi:hypothetical protein
VSSKENRQNYFVVTQFVTNEGQVFFGENKANVFEDVWQESFQVWILFEMALDCLAHHRILSHQQDGVSSQRYTDFLHLRRADIVCADYEALWILIE